MRIKRDRILRERAGGVRVDQAQSEIHPQITQMF